MAGLFAELDRLRSRRLDDDALALLERCISAAERDAIARCAAPAPDYTLRAAVIHRRRRAYAAEIEVLERWMGACPGPPDPTSLVGVRLVRARRLHGSNRPRTDQPAGAV